MGCFLFFLLFKKCFLFSFNQYLSSKTSDCFLFYFIYIFKEKTQFFGFVNQFLLDFRKMKVFMYGLEILNCFLRSSFVGSFGFTVFSFLHVKDGLYNPNALRVGGSNIFAVSSRRATYLLYLT